MKIIKQGLAAPDDPIFTEGVQFFSKRAKPSTKDSPEDLKAFKERSKKFKKSFLDSLNKAALENDRSDKGGS